MTMMKSNVQQTITVCILWALIAGLAFTIVKVSTSQPKPRPMPLPNITYSADRLAEKVNALSSEIGELKSRQPQEDYSNIDRALGGVWDEVEEIRADGVQQEKSGGHDVIPYEQADQLRNE